MFNRLNFLIRELIPLTLEILILERSCRLLELIFAVKYLFV